MVQGGRADGNPIGALILCTQLGKTQVGLLDQERPYIQFAFGRHGMCVFRVAGSWRQVARLVKELFETLDGVRADAEDLGSVPHRMGQVVVEDPSS